MKQFSIGLGGLVLLGLLVGCSSKPSIVGEWKASGGGFSGPTGAQAGEVTFDFKADKTFAIKTAAQEGVHFEMSGSYTTTDDTVAMTIGEAGLKGDVPPEAAQMMKAFEPMFAQMKGQKMNGKLTFSGADKASVVFDSMPGAGGAGGALGQQGGGGSQTVELTRVTS